MQQEGGEREAGAQQQAWLSEAVAVEGQIETPSEPQKPRAKKSAVWFLGTA